MFSHKNNLESMIESSFPKFLPSIFPKSWFFYLICVHKPVLLHVFYDCFIEFQSYMRMKMSTKNQFTFSLHGIICCKCNCSTNLQPDASQIYLLTGKNYRISRSIKASWFLDNFNKVIAPNTDDVIVSDNVMYSL